MKQFKVYPQVECPVCNSMFAQVRSNKKFCSDNCRKTSSARKLSKVKVRNRKVENYFASTFHYDRAAWLTYDIIRLPEIERNLMYQRLLEFASSSVDKSAEIRRTLLDPKLLGADYDSYAGRFSHDRKTGISNISKQVYQFCMNNYGCSTKDCILDNGKPAERLFVGDPIVEKPSCIERCQPNREHVSTLRSLTGISRQAYHGMLIKEFEEKLSEVRIAA